MTELEKLRAGLDYDMWDEEVTAMKTHALLGLEKLNSVAVLDTEGRIEAIRELFGSVGEHPTVHPGFHCDCGKNISVGDNFLVNYNVVILDRGPVTIGNNVLIGPGVVISSVGHPISTKGRRAHLARTNPVVIGDDVWIGANAVILPGVKIGNNVVVAAGAVVTKDVEDDSIVAGVPAVKIRDLKDVSL